MFLYAVPGFTTNPDYLITPVLKTNIARPNCYKENFYYIWGYLKLKKDYIKIHLGYTS